MPELPETETIARDLEAMILGAQITQVELARPDVLRGGSEVAFRDALVGGALCRVWRRAKCIVLDVAAVPADTRWHVVVQPRFTGGLLVDDGTLPPAERTAICVTAHLADGRRLHYRDVRRLGTVALMDEARFAGYSAGLGPEPLDPELTAEAFSGFIRYSSRPIKVVLMDQRHLAGVGNIYANESLWRASIDPSRAAASLTAGACADLLAALREVLTASIAARGTSFRDYRDARGARGRFVEQLAAYGRAGLPCLRCGRRLVGTHAVDGRQTVFCPTCQR
jgi:formamidopyrimidine-DNA glycosylase